MVRNTRLWNREGKYKIPLLKDIMDITKDKIFMNLEIKDDNDEIWEKIKELIEKKGFLWSNSYMLF